MATKLPTKEKNIDNLLIADPEKDIQKEIDKLQKSEENPEEVGRKVPDHEHNGSDASRVSVKNLVEFFEIVSVAPTHRPRTPWEQIKLYVNGATYRIYFYDYKAKAWRFA